MKSTLSPVLFVSQLLALVDLSAGQDASTDAVVSVTPSSGFTDPNPDREDVCSNQTRSGEELWCYQCEQSYAKNPNDAYCLNNITQVALRRCGPRDRYCKVERMDLRRNVMTIERGCVQDCYYGCRYNGYGLTQKRCTSCCNKPCCNDGNKGNTPRTDVGLHVLTMVIIATLTCS